ncbi:hypothetical protein PFISCL1PPCAC_21252, partial [Pristionchus fissidentatus]
SLLSRRSSQMHSTLLYSIQPVFLWELRTSNGGGGRSLSAAWLVTSVGPARPSRRDGEGRRQFLDVMQCSVRVHNGCCSSWVDVGGAQQGCCCCRIRRIRVTLK